MEEIIRFVMLAQSARFTVSELCEQFGISRKTGYKYLDRYTADGLNSCHAVATWANNARHNFWSVSPKISPAFFTGSSRISVKANASNSCVNPRLRPSNGARTV